MSAKDEKQKPTAPPQKEQWPLSPDGSIDVDRVKVKVLVLCKTKKLLDPVANYLIRRGWETVVTANLRESFKVVTVFKPDFVLVSVNIPSPKLASLPTVLYQTFHVPVVTFGETSDTRTLMGMQTIQSNYKLSGAVSGPSVHRRVKQILQDMHKNDSVAESAAMTEGESDQNIQSFLQGRGKKNLGPNMLRFSSDKKSTDGGLIISKGGAAKAGSRQAGENDNADSAEELADLDLEALAAEFGAETEGEDKDSPGPALIVESAESGPAPTHGEREDGIAGAGDSVANQQGPSGGGANLLSRNPLSPALTAAASAAPPVSRGPVLQPHKQAPPVAAHHGLPVVELDPNDREKFEKTIRDEEALIQSLFGESKVNQALKVIALKSALPLEPNAVDLTVLEECTIIPLKILRKTAYLIIVVTGTVQDDVQYIQRLLVHLRHDLAASFEMVSILPEERMGVHIDFDQMEQSDQTKGNFALSLRTGRGTASLLLVYENVFNATVYEEEKSSKARININELIPDLPVGVDIFLHLPKNNKDYLYLRPRSSISQEQKERLLKKDAKLFVDRKDVANYKGAIRRNKTLESHVSGGRNSKKKSA